jgi:Carboxypeptidase regulatory-like domain
MKIRCAAALVLLSAGLSAQDFRATLTGIITDPSGAAVPGATVRAINLETNSSKEVKTTSIGNYTIPYLDPGNYKIDVAAPGFQTLIRENIVLRVADKVNLPLQLAVGQATESVTVSGAQAVIETADASRGLVFDPMRTQQYPLNGRQTYMLLSLTPGVMYTTETFGPGGNSGTRGWDTTNAYKINGARTGQNLFLLNGAPISDNNGTWQLAPNVEAVQEFKVMTNTYDSSYGRFGGGVVNTTIKGGSNDWHGDVFDYFRNAVLDANRTENKQTTPNTKRPAHNQHQFGGVVGGAIRKNKDFIFGSFEGWREVQPASVVSSVPAPGLIDGQHFADYGYLIYDPMTSHDCVAPTNCRGSAYIRDLFPGNVIPKNRISPVGQKVLSYYPAANGPIAKALSSNYYTNTNGRYRYDQPMGRWDHNIGDSDKVYALVTYQHGKEYRNSTGFAPPAGSGDINSQRTDQNYITAWTHVINPTAVLDVRGSFARYTSLFPRYTDYDFTGDKVGMTNMPHAPTVLKSTTPRFDVGGLTQLFALSSSGEWSTYNQWNFTPSLMLTRGKHSIRTGFEYHHVMNGVGNKNWANGTFSFDQGWTRQLSGYNGGTYDGSSIASLLLGYPASGQVDWQDNPYRTRPYWAVYVQDDWKISRTLTMNLGLRYDVQIPWLERYDRSNRGWDYSTKNPYSDASLANWAKIKAQYDATNPKYPFPAAPSVMPGGFKFAGVNGEPRRLYDTDWTNLGPRVGVAWQVLPKTVIRAGAGVYYMSPTQNDTTTGFAQTTSYVPNLDGKTPSPGSDLSGRYSLVNPYPDGLLQPIAASQGLATNVGRGVSFDPPRFKIPRTYQYSFGIQRQLPWNMLAEVSYAGNYQIYINFGTAINEISLSDYQRSQGDTAYNSTQVPNPFYGVLPQNGGQGQNPTISRGSLIRPNPVFQGITNNLTQWGWYRYDAMQVKIEKRLLGGEKTGVLNYVLSYTFSKAFEANHRMESWNLSEPVVYQLDNTDKPHMLSFSGIWDLPVGKNRKFLNTGNPIASQFVSGWQVDWIYTYNSGYPTSWPDLVNTCGGEWHATNQNRDSWFNNNKSCYQTRQSYTFRLVPDRFSDIRNPATGQLNIALEKTTRVNDRFKWTFRAEAFNVSNTPDYAGPDTSFGSDRFGMLPNNQRNWPRLIQLSAKLFF